MDCCFGGDRRKPGVTGPQKNQDKSEVASNRSNISKKSLVITDAKMKSKIVYNTQGIKTNDISTNQTLKKIQFPNYGKQTVRQTRSVDYGQQNKSGIKSHLHAQTSQLNFALDDQSGISNTFNVPHFNYDLSIAEQCYFVGKNKQNLKSLIRRQK